MQTETRFTLKLLPAIKHRSCCYYWLVVLLAYLVWSNNIHAEEYDSSLRYEIIPYLWAASFSGTTAAEGEESPPIDSGYSFFAVDNLDGVASTTFLVRDQQWDYLFDFMYVAYEDVFFEGSPQKTSTRLEGSIVEFAGIYKPRSLQDLDIVAGVRHQDIEVELSSYNRKSHATVDWFDPFVGLIYKRDFTSRLHVLFRGDVGGGRSDIAVNTEAMLRYQFNKTFSAKFGYRYLKVTLKETSFIYDISLDGLLFGLGVRF